MNPTITPIFDDIATIVAQYPEFTFEKQPHNEYGGYTLTTSHPLIASDYTIFANSEQTARHCKTRIENYLKRKSTLLNSVTAFANYFGNEFEVKQVDSPTPHIQMKHRESKKLVSIVLKIDTATLYRHIDIVPTEPSVTGMGKLSIVHEIATYLRPTPMRTLYERIETELARPITDYVREIETNDLQPNLV